jgi:hypothetical protein
VIREILPNKLERQKKLKRDKYEADLRRLNMSFTPFAVESMGGFGRFAKRRLDGILRLLTRRSLELPQGTSAFPILRAGP